ncbi:PadR family transcriptional regulator [Arthrobacter flavus]|uniref:PadR family transcriptional regulator n=1 Tax=Arthrobacter flavus TaxID=95172 RepID=A0ABW4Q376_9MICC
MSKDVEASGVARSALPVAILAALSLQPTHGYALIEILNSYGFPDLKGGTLYPLLARLEQQGLIQSQWNHDQSGPGRKIFTTTGQGHFLLDAAIQAWDDMGRNLKELSTRGEATP